MEIQGFKEDSSTAQTGYCYIFSSSMYWGSGGETLLERRPRKVASCWNDLKLHSDSMQTTSSYVSIAVSVDLSSSQQYDSIVTVEGSSITWSSLATVYQDDWYLAVILQPSQSHGRVSYSTQEFVFCMNGIARHTVNICLVQWSRIWAIGWDKML